MTNPEFRESGGDNKKKPFTVIRIYEDEFGSFAFVETSVNTTQAAKSLSDQLGKLGVKTEIKNNNTG